jgi:hypothetical protein
MIIAELQIGTDPTPWCIQPDQYDTVAAALAEPRTPFAVDVFSPLEGRLVLSPLAAGSVALTQAFKPVGWVPNGAYKATAPLLYLPSSAGPGHHKAGHTLAAGTDLAVLERKLIAAMGSPGSVLSLALDVPGQDGKGTVLLSVATLAYVVLSHAAAAG